MEDRQPLKRIRQLSNTNMKNKLKDAVHQQKMNKEDVYIHTMDCYSAIKRNEIGSFLETWMDLECHTE